jgi:hypothetical protein
MSKADGAEALGVDDGHETASTRRSSESLVAASKEG